MIEGEYDQSTVNIIYEKSIMKHTKSCLKMGRGVKKDYQKG
jgi:hypothetical protein